MPKEIVFKEKKKRDLHYTLNNTLHKVCFYFVSMNASHIHICVCNYCNAIEKCPAPFHEQTEIQLELKLNKNIIYKLDTKEKTYTMKSKIEIRIFQGILYKIINKFPTCYLSQNNSDVSSFGLKIRFVK